MVILEAEGVDLSLSHMEAGLSRMDAGGLNLTPTLTLIQTLIQTLTL